MNIQSELNGTTLTVAPQGRLDTVTAPGLDDFLSAHLDGITALRFDLTGLEYISSAGLRSLLSAHKKMRGAMTVCNVNEVNREIFEITGFTDILHFE
ncbi:MAG: STAS domain-containing protein [Clostridia bacterium]|nr:STAS domain-containing protein [Clostridia bacterium]